MLARPQRNYFRIERNISMKCNKKKDGSQYLAKGCIMKIVVHLWLLSVPLIFLVDNENLVHPLRDRKTYDIQIFFFANKESLRLMKKFQYVAIIDAIYKTNN